jgi:hypothetical protein
MSLQPYLWENAHFKDDLASPRFSLDAFEKRKTYSSEKTINNPAYYTIHYALLPAAVALWLNYCYYYIKHFLKYIIFFSILNK